MVATHPPRRCQGWIDGRSATHRRRNETIQLGINRSSRKLRRYVLVTLIITAWLYNQPSTPRNTLALPGSTVLSRIVHRVKPALAKELMPIQAVFFLRPRVVGAGRQAVSSSGLWPTCAERRVSCSAQKSARLMP